MGRPKPMNGTMGVKKPKPTSNSKPKGKNN